jgi:MFS family permease
LSSLRTGAIAAGVALVLSDSSIVVLALPEIFREFDTTVEGVSWVLISFNLALALVAVPGALAARRLGPGRTAALGLAVFAGGSLACGLATGLGPLIAGRVVQAIGGALAVTASLELLIAARGGERRGIGFWVGAGAIGAALGPGIGGFLTELVSWQSIFLVQVPVALLVAGVAWLLSGDPTRFLAVLVVATPCPLLIAIPVAIVGSVSQAARRGTAGLAATLGLQDGGHVLCLPSEICVYCGLAVYRR